MTVQEAEGWGNRATSKKMVSDRADGAFAITNLTPQRGLPTAGAEAYWECSYYSTKKKGRQTRVGRGGNVWWLTVFGRANETNKQTRKKTVKGKQ